VQGVLCFSSIGVHLSAASQLTERVQAKLWTQIPANMAITRLFWFVACAIMSMGSVVTAAASNGAHSEQEDRHDVHEHRYRPALSVTIVLVTSSAISVLCGVFILYTFLRYKVLRR